jgi:cholesterol transport system auxiliary component
MRVSARAGPVMRLGLTSTLALVLCACSFQRTDPLIPTVYDLGPPRAYAVSNPGITGTIVLPPVTAPAALDDNAIVYRLLYEDAARPQTYTMSHWAAQPAAMLTERLRSRFAAVTQGAITPLDSARSDYTLRLELQDFSQVFEAPGQSRASLRARATLLSSADRKLLTQREFDVQRPAAPNAQGAVKGLTEAADSFIEELVKWTVQSVRSTKDATQTAAEKK